MLHRSERILDNIPVGSLGIIAVDGCEEMGNKVNDYLVKGRDSFPERQSCFQRLRKAELSDQRKGTAFWIW